jgi:sulfofructose kinase
LASSATTPLPICIAEVRKAGVEAKIITARDCSSHQSFILVEDSGERTVLWKRDERLTLRPEELRREWITEARALHVDGRDTAAAITAAAGRGRPEFPWSPISTSCIPDVEQLIEKVDYLIVSREYPRSASPASPI